MEFKITGLVFFLISLFLTYKGSFSVFLNLIIIIILLYGSFKLITF